MPPLLPSRFPPSMPLRLRKSKPHQHQASFLLSRLHHDFSDILEAVFSLRLRLRHVVALVIDLLRFEEVVHFFQSLALGLRVEGDDQLRKDLVWRKLPRGAPHPIVGLTTMAATLKAMKIKYDLDLMFCRATGQIWATIMDPIDPPLAEIQRPLARTWVGNI